MEFLKSVTTVFALTFNLSLKRFIVYLNVKSIQIFAWTFVFGETEGGGVILKEITEKVCV